MGGKKFGRENSELKMERAAPFLFQRVQQGIFDKFLLVHVALRYKLANVLEQKPAMWNEYEFRCSYLSGSTRIFPLFCLFVCFFFTV